MVVAVPMTAAAVSFSLVVVMIAFCVRIIGKASRKVRLYRLVRTPGHAAKQADPRFCQSRLCAAANAAADQYVHLLASQKPRQRAVPLTVGVCHTRRNNLAVFHIVYFKLFCVPEVLEHISVFICNRNFHDSAQPVF